MNALKKFAVTASFVTRLPLCTLPADHDSGEMTGLSKYLPAVGFIVAAVLLLLSWLLSLAHATDVMTGASLTTAWLVLTGGLHFDGLMDTADGVFSHRDRQRMLEIMSDSRVGNFGAMAGWCTLLIKFAALSSLPPAALTAPIVLVPAWARWCETFAIGAFPYLKEEGMGKIWHDTTKYPRDLILAALLPLAATIGFAFSGSPSALVVAGGTMLCGLAASRLLNRILGGQTGDTYGATVELAEAGGLAIAAIFFRSCLSVC